MIKLAKTRSITHQILAIGTVLILGACNTPSLPSSSTDQPSTNTPSPGQPSTGTPQPSNSTLAATTLGDNAATLGDELSNLLIKRIIEVSTSQNRVVTTGTLTENAQGAFAFSNTPSDRLHLVARDGSSIDFFITTLQTNDGSRFFEVAHTLEFRAKFQNTDLNLRSTRSGAFRVLTVRGSMVLEGKSFNLDLSLKSGRASDFGQNPATGQVSLDASFIDEVRGSLQSSGFNATILEATEFKAVGSNSIVTQQKHFFNNAWNEGSEQFKLQGRIQQVFRDGRPIEQDFWQAIGNLTRNGTPVGGFGRAFTGNVLEFFLETPQGKIQLGTFGF